MHAKNSMKDKKACTLQTTIKIAIALLLNIQIIAESTNAVVQTL